jgi:hypothetical protein
MRIEPNSEPMGMRGIQSRTPAAQPPVAQDKLDLGAAAKLNRALEQTPDVRADKVARAKALVADQSYPPKAVLGQVAEALASQNGGSDLGATYL